ncbi:MAG: OmpL47-type beta-barrel domain-containing protein [Candidatus Thorarchaeota archaeon]
MKFAIKKKIFILGLLLLLFSNTIIFIRFRGIQSFNQKAIPIPKLSQTVDIKTPENKTYFAPMSGYYPGSYGFENDKDGAIPAGWENASTSGSVIHVLESKYGHNKVLEGIDTGTTGIFRLNYYFNATEGTIEFWIAVDTAASTHIISTHIFDNIGTRLFGLRFEENNIKVFTSTGQQIVSTYNVKTWYHFRFDYRSDSGNSYEGLNQNEFKCYLNGIYNGTYGFENNGDPDNLWCRSTLSNLNPVRGYWDAFGFSWDPDYSVGNNLQEGLLLSFENSTTLDWIGYSLNEQANKTILGNTTIPMLSDGVHKIQLFCNDTFGTDYQSNIRYFSVDTTVPYINILSPPDDEFFGNTPPDYQVTYSDLTINSTWYYLVGPGTKKVMFSGFTGTINQTEWDKLGGGPATIRFYINDSGGLESFDEVVVQKDLTPPTSSIFYIPYISPNIVNISTEFSLSANDGIGSGVAQLRYKVNDSSWYDYTVPFNLSSYSYAYYRITYQAIDTVGNIESENSILVLLEEIPSDGNGGPGGPSEPGIPGFSLLLVLSLMGVISLLYIKRYIKKLKF